MIIPRTPVTIRQLGRDPVVCDRNQIVFYNPGARFFRTLRTTAGDHCYFVELSPQLVLGLAGGMGSFPFVFGPCDASSFPAPEAGGQASQGAASRRTPCRGGADGRCRRRRSRARGSRAGQGIGARATRAARREIVDQTKRLLVARYRSALDHAEIAASLAVSRFQLSRIFREWTGSISASSAIGTRFSVRAALDRLSNSNARLFALAGELGYSNPAT